MHPIIQAAQIEICREFNSNPKRGIKKLKELLKDEKDVTIEDEIAKFFMQNKKNLNLEAVGDYLGTDDITEAKENNKVLAAYTSLIDIKGKSFTEALKTYLNNFHLPGESQKIDRIMESFGSAFYKQNKNLVANAEAAYVIAFQTIMLNTNLHNPNVKEQDKYTIKQVIGYLKDKDNNPLCDEALIVEIFNDIQAKPLELHFVKNAPGYEFSSPQLSTDSNFNKIKTLFQSDPNSNNIFQKLAENIHLTVEQPKPWVNALFGYEGKITLRANHHGSSDNNTINGVVTVQVYMPNILSRCFFGNKPKLIIQPVFQEGTDPQKSITLAAKVSGLFSSVPSINATYDYDKESLDKARKAVMIEKNTQYSYAYDELAANSNTQKNQEEEESVKNDGVRRYN